MSRTGELKAKTAGLILMLLSLCLWATLSAPGVSAAPVYPPRNGDPCALNLRVPMPISLTASGQVIAGVAGEYTYICHIAIVSATAQNIALVEGTGTTCGTSTAGMAGGATAATGWNFALEMGIVEGAGNAWVLATATKGDNVCLLSSSTGQISGVIDYAQQ